LLFAAWRYPTIRKNHAAGGLVGLALPAPCRYNKFIENSSKEDVQTRGKYLCPSFPLC